ncbi:MAG: hypothetical protein BWK73_07160 [Thiothrix lacustris]|uniref:Uncharacterized protein n=1 Tax=Thiothrix lacustris TaxID=525917 RepID=A0A1Y1QWS0_9GAMM|nr:MAG: hypothetical protein BWK73_07160 [Thiothrix lacustris]
MLSRPRIASPSITTLSAITIGAIFMVMAGSASANRVILVATANNQSILLPVSWSVFKLDDKRSPPKPVAELQHRHSGTVYLPAGDYRATVTQAQVVKETVFKVEANVDRTVNIAFD